MAKIELGRSADSIEPEPVKWAWTLAGRGRLPSGTLSIAAGREGTGKSTCATWLAAQTSRGTLRGAWHGHPGRVLYVTTEDSWKHTIVPRLMAAGADLSMVYQVDVVVENSHYGRLTLPRDTDSLGDLIAQHDVRLLVLDPLLSMIDARNDAHSNQQIRQALEPIVAVAERTGALIFGLAHFVKGDAADAMSAILGASAFKDVARSVFVFANDPLIPNLRVMSQVKNSLGRTDLPSLAYETRGRTIPTKKGPADTSYLYFTGYAPRSVDDIRSARTHDIDEFLMTYLYEHGPTVQRADVIRAGEAEYSESSLKRAARRLGIEQQRAARFQGGSVWSLNNTYTQSELYELNELCEPNDLNDPNDESGPSDQTRPFGSLRSLSPRARTRVAKRELDFTNVTDIKKNA